MSKQNEKQIPLEARLNITEEKLAAAERKLAEYSEKKSKQEEDKRNIITLSITNEDGVIMYDKKYKLNDEIKLNILEGKKQLKAHPEYFKEKVNK